MDALDEKTNIMYRQIEQTKDEKGTCVGCAFSLNNPEMDLLCDIYGHNCKETTKVFKKLGKIKEI